MTSKQKNAIRQHPIFGATQYGLGPTVDTKENLLQIGQTGFAPGFLSMDFYFPASKTSIIVLQNINYTVEDFKNKFYFHTKILNILRESFITY